MARGWPDPATGPCARRREHEKGADTQAWPAIALTGVAGIPFAVFASAQGLALQVYSPAALRGRVFSLAAYANPVGPAAQWRQVCDPDRVFDGFEEWDQSVGGGITLRGRSCGAGPAVVLLHGHPRTHTTWHRVAPRLVDAGYRVVCPDLRGYGRSSKPAPDADHEVYCDRAMAGDVVALMHALGHERFAVVGHDRGSYVAYRCALDHPDRVGALAVLDSVPIVEALERADARFAEKWWHWFFFCSPAAHRVITADPLGWYQPDPLQMGQQNYDDMVAAVTNAETVCAMLEDYRASLHVDRRIDEQDRAAGRTIACPTLVAWSTQDDMPELYGDPAQVWRPWCSGPLVSGTVNSGHHMAEENPEELTALLLDFLRSHGH